jgi:hypothetical protein
MPKKWRFFFAFSLARAFKDLFAVFCPLFVSIEYIYPIF